MFCKNIRLEDRHRLREPKSADLISQFVGEDNTKIIHDYTKREERFFDFILRHTLYRPRDLMAIGKSISDINPTLRTPDRIKYAVFSTAQTIMTTYMTEMAPFVDIPNEYLYRLIRKNVLNRKELTAIAKNYVKLSKKNNTAIIEHPFCSLFQLGLLGVLKQNRETGEKFQYFVRFDELPAEDRMGIIGDADLDSLLSVIERKTGRQLPERAGHERPVRMQGGAGVQSMGC